MEYEGGVGYTYRCNKDGSARWQGCRMLPSHSAFSCICLLLLSLLPHPPTPKSPLYSWIQVVVSVEVNIVPNDGSFANFQVYSIFFISFSPPMFKTCVERVVELSAYHPRNVITRWVNTVWSESACWTVWLHGLAKIEWHFISFYISAFKCVLTYHSKSR